MIRYLCGCVDEVVLNRDVDFLKQYFTYDSQGFIICQVHRMRREGWQTVPYTANTMPFPGVGEWSALEWERYITLGTKPGKRVLKLETHDEIRDRRDNRDPAILGQQILDARRQSEIN